MTTFEKKTNFLMKILGILFAIESICTFLGYWIPKPWGVGTLYMLIAIILLFGKYSKPKKNNY